MLNFTGRLVLIGWFVDPWFHCGRHFGQGLAKATAGPQFDEHKQKTEAGLRAIESAVEIFRLRR